MAAYDCAPATALVLQSEGGYVNNPRDPGGATNRGCTLKECQAVYGKKFTLTSLKGLTAAEASTIFKKYYWDAVQGDELPAGVDYALYDYSVNSGPARATNVILKLVNSPSKKLDYAAIHTIDLHDEVSLIDAICDERLAFMRSLTSEWEEFGHGWTNRVLSVRTRSKRMALVASQHGPSVASAPGVTQALAMVVPHEPTPKAKIAKPQVAPVAAGTGIVAVTTALPAAIMPHHSLFDALVGPVASVAFGGLLWALQNWEHSRASIAPAALPTVATK